MNIKSSFIVLLILLMTSCSLTPPKISESDYFTTKSGGFLFSKKEKKVNYTLSVASRGNIKENNFIVAEFENPLGGKPLESTHLVKENESEFHFKSPPIKGLKAYSNYNTKVYLYENESREKLLGTHEQSIQSIVNQKDLNW